MASSGEFVIIVPVEMLSAVGIKEETSVYVGTSSGSLWEVE